MQVKVNGQIVDQKLTRIVRVTADSLRQLKGLQSELHRDGTTATLCGGPTGGYFLNVRQLKTWTL